VALDAVLTTPAGKTLTVPGFFMVDQERKIEDGAELMLPHGNGVWKVRFTPMEAGRYTCTLRLRDRTGEVTQEAGLLRGPQDGGARVRPAEHHRSTLLRFRQWRRLPRHRPQPADLPHNGPARRRGDAQVRRGQGELQPLVDGLVWLRHRVGRQARLVPAGRRARIDLVLDVARDLGLCYMMCMDTHQDFREGGWLKNPFNAANGGPCATPAEWFTKRDREDVLQEAPAVHGRPLGLQPPRALLGVRQRVRGLDQSPDEIKLPWHREMSDYLASIDPFDHLITTSFWGHTGPPAYWELPNIDIAQTHLYTTTTRTFAEAVRGFSLHQWGDRAEAAHLRRVRHPQPLDDGRQGPGGLGPPQRPLGRAVQRLRRAARALVARELHRPAEPLLPLHSGRELRRLGLPFGTARWEPLRSAMSPSPTPTIDRDQRRRPSQRSRVGQAREQRVHAASGRTFQGDLKPQELLHR